MLIVCAFGDHCGRPIGASANSEQRRHEMLSFGAFVSGIWSQFT